MNGQSTVEKLDITPSGLGWDLIEEVGRAGYNYTVGLAQGESLFGSGTLISLDNRIFVLTATHVVRCLERDEASSLKLVVTLDPHRLTILPMPLIPKIFVGMPEGPESDGPDIAVLEITKLPQLGAILAKKSVYPLEKSIELRNQLTGDLGIWAALGCVEEMTETNEKGYNGDRLTTVGFTSLAGSRPAISAPVDGFDVLTFRPGLSFKAQGPLYGGMSGGGLWWCDVEKSNGSLQVGDVALAGVIFYQGKGYGDQDWRDLHANGPKTLCEVAVGVIRNL